MMGKVMTLVPLFLPFASVYSNFIFKSAQHTHINIGLSIQRFQCNEGFGGKVVIKRHGGKILKQNIDAIPCRYLLFLNPNVASSSTNVAISDEKDSIFQASENVVQVLLKNEFSLFQHFHLKFEERELLLMSSKIMIK